MVDSPSGARLGLYVRTGAYDFDGPYGGVTKSWRVVVFAESLVGYLGSMWLGLKPVITALNAIWNSRFVLWRRRFARYKGTDGRYDTAAPRAGTGKEILDVVSVELGHEFRLRRKRASRAHLLANVVRIAALRVELTICVCS